MNVFTKCQESKKNTKSNRMGDMGNPSKIGARGEGPSRIGVRGEGPSKIGARSQGEHHSTDPRTAENAENEEWEPEKPKIIHVLASAIQRCSSVRNQYFCATDPFAPKE